MSDLLQQWAELVQTSNENLRDAVTNEAIDRAGNHADGTWMLEARLALEAIIATYEYFTTDDVWQLLDERGVHLTHEPRAMGALIREQQRLRRIKPTGRYKKSSRIECHKRPIMIWETL
jgi:hypothetical protein